VFGQFKQQSDV